MGIKNRNKMKHTIIKKKLSSLGTERNQMMMAMTRAKFNATAGNERSNEKLVGAETYVITIDSCCSYSIAIRRSNFCGKMTTCNITIQGFNCKSFIMEMMTWKFKMEDDEGVTNAIRLASTLYSPKAPFHLHSPQHWSQQEQTQMVHAGSYNTTR